jgi:hypothetical protein
MAVRTGVGFALAAFCWWLASAAAARDIYVSNLAGDDRRDGHYPDVRVVGGGPVRTISKALRLAEAGDRIVVAKSDEPYRETLSISGTRHGGNLVRPLVIEGGGATLDGTAAIPPDEWQHVAGNVFAYQPARLGHQQLFAGGRATRKHPSRFTDPAPPRLAALEWCFWRGRIYFCTEPRKMPVDYELSCCDLQTGITLYYVRDVLIRDLVVRGFQLDGVAVHDVVRACRLENVTAVDNGMSGVSARGASLVELDGCTLSGNGASQLRVEDFARVWLYDCRLLDATAPAIVRRGGEVISRQATPGAR